MKGQLLSDGYPCTGEACCRQCADGPCCVMPSLPSDGQLAFWRDMHPEWTSVGESATASGLAQSTTSEMLSALHAYGFIERRKSGNTVYYRPKAKVVVARTTRTGPPPAEVDTFPADHPSRQPGGVPAGPQEGTVHAPANNPEKTKGLCPECETWKPGGNCPPEHFREQEVRDGQKA